jgi:hypothetical protein
MEKAVINPLLFYLVAVSKITATFYIGTNEVKNGKY